MRVYIIGPINSVPDADLDAFRMVQERLEAAGHEARNPLDFVEEEVKERAAVMGTAFCDTEEYRAIMRRCMGHVEWCDAIVPLTGWQHSRGARAEKAYAECLGKRIASADELCEEPVRAIRWTGDAELEPKRGYVGDAGFDLYVAEDVVVPYAEFVDVPCGVSVELPDGVWAMLTGRSSALRKRGLLVTQGIIDNGYRGPLYAGVRNLHTRNVVLKRGERIAQLIPFSLEAPQLALQRVDSLNSSDRGHNGFGSTGA